MYGEASETLVAEHTILGTKREKKVCARPFLTDGAALPFSCLNLWSFLVIPVELQGARCARQFCSIPLFSLGNEFRKRVS